MKAAKRRVELDAMKALAALFVLLYHSQLFYYDNISNTPVDICVRSLLSACCPMFFFVNGVLASYGDTSMGRSVRSAGKLLFLTLFWGFVAWPVLQIQHGGVVKIGEWVSGVLTLETWRTNVFWFLPVLAMLQLMRPFVTHIYKGDKKLFRYLVTASIVFSFGFDAIARVGNIFGWFSESGAPLKAVGFLSLFRPIGGHLAWAFAYYLLGMSVKAWEDKIPGKASVQIALLVIDPALLAAYGGMAMAATGQNYDVTWEGYSFIGTAAVVLSIYKIILKYLADGDGLIPKVLTYVGSNALAVYVLPWLLTYPLSQLVFSIQSPVERLACGAFACVALLLGAATIGSVVKKTRMGRWLLS